jgi:hypothetical protein
VVDWRIAKRGAEAWALEVLLFRDWMMYPTQSLSVAERLLSLECKNAVALNRSRTLGLNRFEQVRIYPAALITTRGVPLMREDGRRTPTP